MSEKCIVGSCCGCCTLRTGALVTAILTLIGAIINVASAIYAIVAENAQVGWFNVVVNVLMLILAIVLLHGVRTQKPNLIKIWVYVEVVLIILMLISTLILFFRSWDITALLTGLIVAGIMIYLVVVVRSYAFELESGGGGGNTV